MNTDVTDMRHSSFADWKTELPPSAQSAVFEYPGGICRVESVTLAGTALRRFIGLMGHAPLGKGRGLFLGPCGSIHTFFMRFDLDIVFVSRDFRVVRVVTSVKPWRMVWGGGSAWGVLELQSGWFDCASLAPGARMGFEPWDT